MAKEMNLGKGKTIEVSRTNDDAWYAAAIIRSMQKNGRISVEFQTLFSGDDRSKPLKEIVDLSHVRPHPPPDDFDLAFESGDEVDAFCNGGWKPGKISGVLENSSFLVILSNTHEAKAFRRLELRVHRDWIGGRWISAREQRKLEMDFGSGTPVEVRSDEEGFVGAWFAAKIVRAIDKNMFTVEYQNLRTDDESQLLRETVYSQNIRPAPPDILESKSFRFLEEVDAWYNDGWWVGVISKVVKNSSYFVYFRDTEEEIEFKHSDLRLHQDWIGAKWVRASQGLKLCD
ncbi:DUF724 domain-containing protein 6 isoform X4 [Cinnamomum micranthum f. kanehirae]|uniref:DUF724 domain-containing protein 6 isoform X4 n=1 Tax=Cinnamomum micranthum f. kanehirae TaxID=337451 RepID=A0A443PWV5_9MAGN|nr:DUF724 domain-containing protein 6 isoform X4 [Cinnamomum micranthum f. kanehirae]